MCTRFEEFLNCRILTYPTRHEVDASSKTLTRNCRLSSRSGTLRNLTFSITVEKRKDLKVLKSYFWFPILKEHKMENRCQGYVR
uniref:Uncharacterized protein n=1 Tax=Nelumbo nucifera TaxID=4432 RepID=A0A822Y2P4_NELNU|nr:TPA_asm: hypothetical protein HUJ06_027990 [Nelumbo nucifera]